MRSRRVTRRAARCTTPPQGSIWARNAPGRSGAAQGHARDSGAGSGLDETIDLPIAPLDATVDPALSNGVTSDLDGDGTVAAAPIGPSGLRREVFGFLPYWELSDKSTTLDWRTLSTVAYFSVGCTSTGSLDKRNSNGTATTGWAGWTSSKMTSIINAAHEHQTRVVLTVSCFAWSAAGASTQAALLGSATRRATLAKQIAAAVRDRGADGANLDFEPIVAGYSDEFTALVRKVRSELNNVAPGYQLTFDTTGSIGNQPIANATAPGGADAVFIMGYDYRTAGSSLRRLDRAAHRSALRPHRHGQGLHGEDLAIQGDPGDPVLRSRLVDVIGRAPCADPLAIEVRRVRCAVLRRCRGHRERQRPALGFRGAVALDRLSPADLHDHVRLRHRVAGAVLRRRHVAEAAL